MRGLEMSNGLDEQTVSHWPTWPDPLDLGLEISPGGPCPYLGDRRMQVKAFRCHAVAGASYQALLDAGFRRAGSVYYQPACSGCRSCVPLRVPVATFRPSRSQKRCRRQNADLEVTTGVPTPTPEKHALYRRYLESRHDGSQSGEWSDFVDFLYRSSTDTIEVECRDSAGQLLGVGICDLTPTAVSSVYHYFDPSNDHSRRSLGTFGSLVEIELARMSGRLYYYLGYWVEGCASMAYKNRLRPCERLDTDGNWRPIEHE